MESTEINEIKVNGVVYVPKNSVSEIEKPEGDYVVVRTRFAGVHAGYLVLHEGTRVVLKNTRRLWYWDGAASLSQVAGEGISKPHKCKFPAAISTITLTGAIEIIPCTKTAKNIIESVAEWKA